MVLPDAAAFLANISHRAPPPAPVPTHTTFPWSWKCLDTFSSHFFFLLLPHCSTTNTYWCLTLSQNVIHSLPPSPWMHCYCPLIPSYLKTSTLRKVFVYKWISVVIFVDFNHRIDRIDDRPSPSFHSARMLVFPFPIHQSLVRSWFRLCHPQKILLFGV